MKKYSVLLTPPEMRGIIWHLEWSIRHGMNPETRSGLKTIKTKVAKIDKEENNENTTVRNRPTGKRP